MQKDSLWQAVLGEIELTLSRGNFVTWFKNTCLLKHEAGFVSIGVPNIFIKQQLEKKYSDLITETLIKNGVTVDTIEYKISALAASPQRSTELEPELSVPSDNTYNQPQTQHQPQSNIQQPGAIARSTSGTQQGNSFTHSYRQGINERYTFDNFVVGGSNELAFAACQAISQQPGTKYNPLFLYGGVGIGKTHLMQAVGNSIAGNNKNAKVLYISTEQFVQEFVDALRFRKTADFASHYRTADVR
jgi:chromosomal replication initiator protein